MSNVRAGYRIRIRVKAFSSSDVKPSLDRLALAIEEFINNPPTPTREQASEGQGSKFDQGLSYLQDIADEFTEPFDPSRINGVQEVLQTLRGESTDSAEAYRKVLKQRRVLNLFQNQLYELQEDLERVKAGRTAGNHTVTDGEADEFYAPLQFIGAWLEKATSLFNLAESLPPSQYVDFGQGVLRCKNTYETPCDKAKFSELYTKLGKKLREMLDQGIIADGETEAEGTFDASTGKDTGNGGIELWGNTKLALEQIEPLLPTNPEGDLQVIIEGPGPAVKDLMFLL
jgi:hypothetical protein